MRYYTGKFSENIPQLTENKAEASEFDNLNLAVQFRQLLRAIYGDRWEVETIKSEFEQMESTKHILQMK